VGRFFFQSPEVCQKLGRQPEFLATGDFTTVAARVRGSWRLHRTSVRVFDSRRLRKTAIISCCQRGKRKKKKRRRGEKEEKKGRKRREKERKGEKKGRRRKGKEGKREYADSVGGCVGRFFFQSPEVGHKLGRQPEFVATGDFTTVAARGRGSRRLHRTSVRVFDSRRLRKTAIISCCHRGKRKKKKRRKEEKEEKKGRKRREKGRKGEKKGRKRKGKEGRREERFREQEYK